MKKIRKNSIIILLLTIVLLFFILRHDYKSIIELITHSNKLYLFLAITVYFISIMIDSKSFHIIIKQYTKKYSYKNTLKLNIITKFFNGVTPLSTGGQPLQIYELYNNNVRLGDATNIVVQFFIIYQIAVVIFSTVAIIFNHIFHVLVKNLFVKKLVILGYVINLIVLLVLFLISFNKNFNYKICKFLIKVLYKLKIVKNKEEKLKIWRKKCDSFYKSATILKNNPKVLVYGTILQLLQITVCYSIPFIISKAIVDNSSLTFVTSIVSCTYVNLIGSYIIIPGASGGIEYAFIKLFSNFFKTSSVLSITILWRFITYYFPVIVGAILFNIKKRNIPLDILDKD